MISCIQSMMFKWSRIINALWLKSARPSSASPLQQGSEQHIAWSVAWEQTTWIPSFYSLPLRDYLSVNQTYQEWQNHNVTPKASPLRAPCLLIYQVPGGNRDGVSTSVAHFSHALAITLFFPSLTGGTAHNQCNKPDTTARTRAGQQIWVHIWRNSQ